MITGAIFSLAYAVISSILSILPASVGFPDSVLSSASYIGGFVGMFSPIMPMATLLTTLTLVFTTEIAIFGYKTLKSLVSHLPQIGGRGH